ncbi:MAG: ribbon-helix-helix protein, CopG family [bacterium]|nr:ribbon-helix-helix protein, CopG family [bacterium]
MKVKTFNIALPEELVVKADEIAKKEYRSRSELIRESLRTYIEERGEWEQVFRFGEKAMKEMGVKSEEEVDKIVYEFRHKQRSR